MGAEVPPCEAIDSFDIFMLCKAKFLPCGLALGIVAVQAGFFFGIAHAAPAFIISKDLKNSARASSRSYAA